MYGRRPLTRLESALYAGIAAILVGVFCRQMLYYMEVAERIAMEATVNQLISAINTRLAYEVMRGEVGNVPAWVRRNPFELARASPANFRGELGASPPGALERGFWAFESSRAELVYFPRLHLDLQTDDPDAALRFKAVVPPDAMGYRLVLTSPYRWE